MSFTRRVSISGSVEVILVPYVGRPLTRLRFLGGVTAGLFTHRADHAEHEADYGKDDVANLEHRVDAIDEPA